jgi:FtsZ-binding cell division protein ZapB
VARRLSERAAAGKETKALRDEVEKLQQENRGLADRLTALEAKSGAGRGRK